MTAVAVYCLLVILLYVLGGYQLHYQPSRGNLQMPAAQSAVAELIDGAVIEQRFTADIQRIQSVSVLWGTYYRQNSGIVTMELLDETGQALLAQSFDAAAMRGGTSGGVGRKNTDPAPDSELAGGRRGGTDDE